MQNYQVHGAHWLPKPKNGTSRAICGIAPYRTYCRITKNVIQHSIDNCGAFSCRSRLLHTKPGTSKLPEFLGSDTYSPLNAKSKLQVALEKDRNDSIEPFSRSNATNKVVLNLKNWPRFARKNFSVRIWTERTVKTISSFNLFKKVSWLMKLKDRALVMLA